MAISREWPIHLATSLMGPPSLVVTLHREKPVATFCSSVALIGCIDRKGVVVTCGPRHKGYPECAASDAASVVDQVPGRLSRFWAKSHSWKASSA